MSDDERTQVMNAGRRQPDAYDEYDAAEYDEEAERRRRRKRNWLIAGLVVLAIALIAFVMSLAGIFQDGADEVPIPNVIDQPEAQATSTLQEAGFTDIDPKKVACHPRPDAEPKCDQDDIGKVIDVEPGVGERVPTSTNIALTVGAEPEQVAVPSLEGMTRAEAEQALNELDLLLDSQVEEREVTDEDQIGKVIEQNPSASTKIEQGSTVSITVGKSQALVDVTNYEGKTFEEAKAALESAGFTVTRNDVDNEQPEGIVVRQQPNGAKAAVGSTITLDVSNGSQQQIDMPDLTGMTEDEAMATLREQGWSGERTVETEEVSDSDQVGRVTSTDPSAGSKIARDQPVVLRIGEQNGSTESSENNIPGLPGSGGGNN